MCTYMCLTQENPQLAFPLFIAVHIFLAGSVSSSDYNMYNASIYICISIYISLHMYIVTAVPFSVCILLTYSVCHAHLMSVYDNSHANIYISCGYYET